jgi:GNAT superfamily N-acetyltransferase
MKTVEIIEATNVHAPLVASQVMALLLELDAEIDINQSVLSEIAKSLIEDRKIFAFLAIDEGESIGVITLHECAAIYAGGLFGEISELYVMPKHRSQNVGQLLIGSAVEKAKELGWKRLEVGSPPEDEWPRTIEFYKSNGFSSIGKRLGLTV